MPSSRVLSTPLFLNFDTRRCMSAGRPLLAMGDDLEAGEGEGPGGLRRQSSGAAQIMRQVSSSGIAHALGVGVGVPEDEHAPEFMCQVCFMDKLMEDEYRLDGCAHTGSVCRDCFAAHLRYEVREEGRVESLKCPCTSEDGEPCEVDVPDEVVQEMLDEETWERVKRLRALREDDASRECPHGCGHVQVGNPDAPIMDCGGCGKKYCFFHSVAHEPNIEACREYKRAKLKDEQQTAALLDKIAMRCPGCGRPVEKNHGCNHMTCSQCGVEFCWCCGSNISGQVGWHYSFTNPLGCPGMMMMGGIAPGSRREAVQTAMREQFTCCGRTKTFFKAIGMFLALPIVIVLSAIVSAISLLFCVLCCVCVTAGAVATGEEEAVMAVGALILSPILPFLAIPLWLYAIAQVLVTVFISKEDFLARQRAAISEEGDPSAVDQPGFGTFAARGGEGVVEEVRDEEKALSAHGAGGAGGAGEAGLAE